jgi:hypothetical protein
MARINNNSFLTNANQKGKVAVILFNATVPESQLETHNLITYKVYYLKITRMIWAEHAARMEKLISAYYIGVRKREKILLGR